eukprot:1552285-Pyramimonas_sp.AAC.1
MTKAERGNAVSILVTVDLGQGPFVDHHHELGTADIEDHAQDGHRHNHRGTKKYRHRYSLDLSWGAL